MKTCPKCGETVSEGAGFCGSCGAQMTVQYPPQVLVPKRNDPMIIITIVIVIIVVIVAATAALYFLRPHGVNGFESPLGLIQQSRTSMTVTLLIVDAPNGALVDGTQISFTHDGDPFIFYVELYSATAQLIAMYSTGYWTYPGGLAQSDLEFTAGMTIVVTSYSLENISNGDLFTISSPEGHFGTTTLTIN